MRVCRRHDNLYCGELVEGNALKRYNQIERAKSKSLSGKRIEVKLKLLIGEERWWIDGRNV